MRRVAIAAGVVIAILLLALAVALIARAATASDPLTAGIDKSNYQAVFLSNGQVFFGRLDVPGGDYYYLRHVYYLASQAGTKPGQGAALTLQKLTKDVHGPKDLVIINSRNVLYVENLKPNSRAAQILNK
jgi:hypothetical protein